jgi:hypothetical protein
LIDRVSISDSIQRDLLRLPDRAWQSVFGRLAHRQLERDVERLLRTKSQAYSMVTASSRPPKIAFATFGSGKWHLVLEILLAHSLALRGAATEMLLCDIPTLPICDERTVFSRQTDECGGCIASKLKLLELSELNWRGLSSFLHSEAIVESQSIVDNLDDAEIEDFRYDGWPIGRWLHVSASHYLRSDARGFEPEKIKIKRRFLVTAIVVTRAITRWLDEIQPVILIAESGAHFMWKIAFELARARDIRVVCREIGKGGLDTHIYSLNSDSMFPNWKELWESTKSIALTEIEERNVDNYLSGLRSKTYDKRATNQTESVQTLRARLNLSPDRKTAVLFTNVTWDLSTAGRDLAFDGLLDWILKTISIARTIKKVDFVIRAHPAENSVLTGDRILELIRHHCPSLPPNVRLVPPDDNVSTHSLFEITSLVLAYCSTTGIEAAIAGKPVLLSGIPHYRGKGFTTDVTSVEEYNILIRQWADFGFESQPATRELARRYFHLFFLRHHITMNWTTNPLEPPFKLKINNLSNLLPGGNASLDVVCSGILNGHEILLPRRTSEFSEKVQ